MFMLFGYQGFASVTKPDNLPKTKCMLLIMLPLFLKSLCIFVLLCLEKYTSKVKNFDNSYFQFFTKISFLFFLLLVQSSEEPIWLLPCYRRLGSNPNKAGTGSLYNFYHGGNAWVLSNYLSEAITS